MRAQIMNSLRKAGDKVRAFDDAYAAKLGQLIMGKDPGIVRGIAGIVAGAPATRRAVVEMNGAEPRLLQMLGQAAPYGIPAASAGLRYGIPAAGAVGIHNILTSGFDQMSDLNIIGQSQEDPNLMVRQTPYLSMP
jgi:hypothetical protein